MPLSNRKSSGSNDGPEAHDENFQGMQSLKDVVSLIRFFDEIMIFSCRRNGLFRAINNSYSE